MATANDGAVVDDGAIAAPSIATPAVTDPDANGRIPVPVSIIRGVSVPGVIGGIISAVPAVPVSRTHHHSPVLANAAAVPAEAYVTDLLGRGNAFGGRPQASRRRQCHCVGAAGDQGSRRENR